MMIHYIQEVIPYAELNQLNSIDLLKTPMGLICQLGRYCLAETNILVNADAPQIANCDLQEGFLPAQLPVNILIERDFGIYIREGGGGRADFIDINRGYTAALALRLVLLGGDENYKSFVCGQNPSLLLARNQFDELHIEFNQRLRNDDLKIAAIYLSAFYNINKNLKLSEQALLINGQEILDPQKSHELLPGLNGLNDNIKKLVCYAILFKFNPSFFANDALFLAELPKDFRDNLISLFKIKSWAAIAGSLGHRAPGTGAGYTKLMHTSFNSMFDELATLTQNACETANQTEQKTEGVSVAKVGVFSSSTSKAISPPIDSIPTNQNRNEM